MGNLIKLGFDTSKNLQQVEEIPTLTYPDGTVPEWSESDGNLINSSKPINPPSEKKKTSLKSDFAGTKPNLPRPPFRKGDVSIDPSTGLASLTPEQKNQGLPGKDEMRSINYWLADFDLRRERGLYHPKILPMANIRETMSEGGFKVPTRGSMITGGQQTKKDPHKESGKRYEKRIKMFIRQANAGKA